MHARYKGLNFDDLACFFLVVICIISLFANVCNWLTTHIQSTIIYQMSYARMHPTSVARVHYFASEFSSNWPFLRLVADRAMCAFQQCVEEGRIFEVMSRCGCHGLHVDTGRLLPLTQQVPREQRHCVFCASGLAEDEQYFVFDCPAYCAIRNRFTNIFWGPSPTLSFFTLHDPKVIARFLRECFEHRNTLVAAQSGHTL